MTHISRRHLLGLAGTVAIGTFTREPAIVGLAPTQAAPPAVRENFPRHDLTLVREVVGASHSNFARVKELVTRQPALAKASWDQGFGDWETALGAAAHTGQKEIAHFLLEHGAPPTIFSAAMLGQLEVVKALIAASPGIQRRPGPHGITLLAHAQGGGPEAAAVVAYLTEVGGADDRPASQPLTAEDRARLAGTYRFGPGTDDVFVIAEVRDFLRISRPNYSSSNLRHLGNWSFHPNGAEAVRLTFERAGDRVVSLTITDADVVLLARRG